MLSDFDSIDLSEGGASGRSNREERMRVAFEKSKVSYANEMVYYEPQWFHMPEILLATRFRARHADYGLNDLYMKRRYTEALDVALQQLEIEGRNLGKGGREHQLIDIAMRCAMKIDKKDVAVEIADKSRYKWSTNPGLALAAAEAYLLSGQSRNALAAVLHAATLRGILAPYVHVFDRALDGIASEMEDERKSVAIRSLKSVVRARAQPFRTLFGPSESTSCASLLPAMTSPSELVARNWVSECGLTGDVGDRLVALVCSHPAGEQDIVDVDRSVRLL